MMHLLGWREQRHDRSYNTEIKKENPW